MRRVELLLLVLWIHTGVAQGTIVFFSENPDGNEYYDASWGFNEGGSLVETAGLSGDKYPVDTNHPWMGLHSLRLKWTSAAGGNWGIAVASPGWEAHNLTLHDSIEYQINGPESISQTDLPDVALEDIYNHKSTRVWLGEYLDGVDNDSTGWQTVRIPLSAFESGPENCDFTVVKTIFHFQRQEDGQEHIAWLDEIRTVQTDGGTLLQRPQGLNAAGHDSRIDLTWQRNPESNLLGYNVYRSDMQSGPYTRIRDGHPFEVLSNYFGINDQSYYYYVTALNQQFEESEPSDTVSATSYAMTTDELLTSIQQATFRYFYHFGHPVSGMARERNASTNTCASGGTGFGLMTLTVAAERGFISRDSAATRTLKIIRFLQDEAERYHGAWAHWINGETGATIPFSTFDNGGDLVETSYVTMGLLTVRQFFDGADAVETEIRERATQLWEEVEWDWYRRTENGNILFWHWSPDYGWTMNLQIRGFNEAMIVYLLAVASPTHSVPSLLYHIGWARTGAYPYLNGSTFYDYLQWVGPDYGGPLFFTHYTFMGFDPRDKADGYCNYFENNRHISLINRAYCIDNPFDFEGYDSLVWGLTASDEPGGYSAHAPFNNDNGTITPTAALGAMPYIPDESIATMNYFYYDLGEDLWGDFGFRDAFNPEQDWVAESYIAIDQGPIVVMIENYRSQLCWNLFMSNPEIQPMLTALGFVSTGIADNTNKGIRELKLFQNYPNPFNPSTAIDYQLPVGGQVTLRIYNLLGQKVRTLTKQYQPAGTYQVLWDGTDDDGHKLASGLYFYQLHAGEHHSQARRMLLTR